MALVPALLWQALGRLWRSPGSSARHAPPNRAMEHDRAIEVYDIIRTIRDPEKPNTLEELEVVTENGVEVQEIGEEEYLVIIRHKLEIYISEGTHSTEEDINKQINDKERVAAAMENPNLREIVEQCVTEPD